MAQNFLAVVRPKTKRSGWESLFDNCVNLNIAFCGVIRGRHWDDDQ